MLPQFVADSRDFNFLVSYYLIQLPLIYSLADLFAFPPIVLYLQTLLNSISMQKFLACFRYLAFGCPALMYQFYFNITYAID